MRAGDLNRRIRIERASQVRDSVGGIKDVWVPIENGESVPAMFRPVRGREKFLEASERELSFRSARFTIRYRNDVKPKDRVVYEDQNWDIVYLAEVGKRDGLEISAEIVI